MLDNTNKINPNFKTNPKDYSKVEINTVTEKVKQPLYNVQLILSTRMNNCKAKSKNQRIVLMSLQIEFCS